jgi:hypothetical protein
MRARELPSEFAERLQRGQELTAKTKESFFLFSEANPSVVLGRLEGPSGGIIPQ